MSKTASDAIVGVVGFYADMVSDLDGKLEAQNQLLRQQAKQLTDAKTQLGIDEDRVHALERELSELHAFLNGAREGGVDGVYKMIRAGAHRVKGSIVSTYNSDDDKGRATVVVDLDRKVVVKNLHGFFGRPALAFEIDAARLAAAER